MATVGRDHTGPEGHRTTSSRHPRTQKPHQRTPGGLPPVTHCMLVVLQRTHTPRLCFFLCADISCWSPRLTLCRCLWFSDVYGGDDEEAARCGQSDQELQKEAC